jgi:LuxR family maltose regulon positive regulatory protein
VRIAQGRLEDARAWARGVAPADSYLAEYDQLTLARLEVAEGDAEAALRRLDRVLDAAAGRDGSLIEARLVRALAQQARGDADAAGSDLAAALAAGVPAGYRRLFLDEGPPLLALLARPPAEARPHAERLLAAAQVPAAPAAAADEGLSEREREVLRLLATELSGPEIARQLYVSVNTLRTHTKHIFSKLDVNTRRAAVRRAGELGLL